MTHVKRMMLEQLQRLNYAQHTARSYIRTVEDFARYFHCRPDRLGPRHIREYQAVLFQKRKLSPGSVAVRLAALRFFYCKTLRRAWSIADNPYPKKYHRLPTILSQEEIRNGLGLSALIHPRHFAGGSEKFLATLPAPKVRAELRKEIETDSTWENWYQHVGKNWDNVLVVQVSAAADKRYEGKSIQQIAALRGIDAWNTFFDLAQLNGVDVDTKGMDENQK